VAALKSTCTGEPLAPEPRCKMEVEETPSLLSSSTSSSVGHSGTSVSSSATIDLSNNEDPATSDLTHDDPDVWVRHGKLTLKLVDKAAIEKGDELNDKHIQMAQYLAKVQFPVTGGLESTLFQGKKKGSCTVNTVQIIYCKKRHHWVTASTKFSESGKVDIYDMMFTKLDAETRSTVKQRFGLKKVIPSTWWLCNARKVHQIVAYFP